MRINELVFDLNELSTGFYYKHEGYMVFVRDINGELLSVKVASPAPSMKVEERNNITLAELKTMVGVYEDDGEEIRHQVFNKVKTIIQKGRTPYLFGPAGTGKNVLCQQIAEELGLDFYYSSTVTQEFKVTGYGDAQGRFVETEFYKAFTRGGLFMLDELDASCPEALVCLNAALANKYVDFPTIGRVEAHPEFRVIAAGNTACRGADALYQARQVIDAATMNRFVFVRVDYDERIERRLCKGDIAFLEFVHDLRKSSNIADYPFVLSYRNIVDAKEFMSDFSLMEVMEMCITKGIPSDDLRVLHGGLCDKSNKYAQVFYELCK